MHKLKRCSCRGSRSRLEGIYTHESGFDAGPERQGRCAVREVHIHRVRGTATGFDLRLRTSRCVLGLLRRPKSVDRPVAVDSRQDATILID